MGGLGASGVILLVLIALLLFGPKNCRNSAGHSEKRYASSNQVLVK